jgi:uncharacterized protein (TIGR02246 family)
MMNDREAVIAVTRSWGQAYLDGDLERILSHYTENALMVSYDGVIAKGHDKIRGIYENWLKPGAPIELDYETVEITLYGDVASHVVKWHSVFPEPYGYEMMCGACQTVLHKQEDGRWLYASEIVCADIDSIEIVETVSEKQSMRIV